VSGSLRLRLFAGAGFFIGLGLFATWFSLQQIFSGYVSAQYEREMSNVVDTLAARLEFADGGLVLEGRPADPRFSLPAGGRYWAVQPEGAEAVRSRSWWDVSIDPAGFARSSHTAFRTGEGPDGEPMLLLERDLSFETASGPRDVAFYAGFSASEMEAALSDFRRELAVMLGLTAFMLSLAAVFQVLVGLRPLEQLQSEVANIRYGAASKLRSDVPTEVKPLVAEINDLLDEKAAALGRARARAADLAHGLKTPLTAILQIAETLPPETGEPIIEHVTMIRRRADRQLQRARLGVGQGGGGGDLRLIVAKLVNVISAIPAPHRLEWNIDIPEDLTPPIDTADLAEVLGNILDNARKWAASRVSVTATRRRSEIVVAIADDGPGIAESERGRILERGAHAGDPQSETGLGLSIAREIVDAYGGSLALSQAGPGGLRVTIALPGVETPRRTSPA
jgi:signal transduction histidine kinase